MIVFLNIFRDTFTKMSENFPNFQINLFGGASTEEPPRKHRFSNFQALNPSTQTAGYLHEETRRPQSLQSTLVNQVQWRLTRFYRGRRSATSHPCFQVPRSAVHVSLSKRRSPITDCRRR